MGTGGDGGDGQSDTTIARFCFATDVHGTRPGLAGRTRDWSGEPAGAR